jgi:DNA-directed RNA polymerase subunit RPC12/RpoP
MEEETKLCSTCDKQIEVPRFRMHEMGCARQNFKCATCGQCVAKADKEEHMENEHKEVACLHCGFKAMKYLYTGHELSCQKQP